MTGMYLYWLERISTRRIREFSLNRPARLNALSIVIEVVEDVVVGGVEDGASDGSDVGEDVTSRSRVFSTLFARKVSFLIRAAMEIKNAPADAFRTVRWGRGRSSCCYRRTVERDR